MIRFAILVSMVTLVGCYATPVAEGPSNNPEVPVALLFSKDGCDIYRFVDHGAHYFARCKDAGQTVGTTSAKACGKATCDEEISATSAR